MGMKSHEPLRVPQGWTGQNRALIVQLERILDDLYKQIGNLTRANHVAELNVSSNSMESTRVRTAAISAAGASRKQEGEISELTVDQLMGR